MLMKRPRKLFGISTNRLGVVGGALALALVGTSSFAVASGAVLTAPSTYAAAIGSLFTGKPLVTIQKNRYSPKGSIPSNQVVIAAVYNVSAKRTTHGIRVSMFQVDVNVRGESERNFKLPNLSGVYRYCIKPGMYGYGYAGGNCASVNLSFWKWDAAQMRGNNNNDYVVSGYLTPDRPLIIYPQQSSGQLTVSTMGQYVTGEKTIARIRLDTSGWGAGDQCEKLKGPPGYKNCIGYSAQFIRGISNTLKVLRPYGYTTTTPPKPIP